MNNNIPELTYSELELLETLNQKYEMLSILSGQSPAEYFSSGDDPEQALPCNSSLVKHRLEIFFGLNRTDNLCS